MGGSRRKLEETETLLRIARATASLDLDEVLSRAVRMTARAVSAGRAAIYVISPDRQWLDLAASTGARSRRSRWPMKDIGPLTARVLATGRMLRVKDFRRHPARSEVTTSGLAYVSFLAIPLHFGGKRLGCLQIGEPDRTRDFSARETKLLVGIADQIAVAIHNARLAHENRRRLQSLRLVSRKLWTAQEQERMRIARELHDEAGQSLTALKLSLAMLKAEVPQGPLSERAEELAVLAQGVLESLRELARDLRPRALDELGLLAALAALVNGFATRTAIALSTDLDPKISLHGDAASTAFRFVQEALTNVARHSGANSAQVRGRITARDVILTVADDGCGFDPDRRTLGLGLAGMRERAQLVGGSLAIESSAGQGTRATLHLRRAKPKPTR